MFAHPLRPGAREAIDSSAAPSRTMAVLDSLLPSAPEELTRLASGPAPSSIVSPNPSCPINTALAIAGFAASVGTSPPDLLHVDCASPGVLPIESNGDADGVGRDHRNVSVSLSRATRDALAR